jgi:hypothetical protein
MIEFHPTSATRRKDPDLPDVITARLLRYQWPGFRTSWLLTSLLDAQVHRHRELVDLYHRRWQIEMYQSYCLLCHRFYDHSGFGFGVVSSAA